jgi:small basic protein
MKFPRQFFGGVLVGIGLGLVLGAGVADGKQKVNYTSIAGVGCLLAIPGAVMARRDASKS